MKKETKKISAELAIGIIVLFSILMAVLIYRAGSFSAALNYIPKITNKKDTTKKEPERILFATNGEREIYKVKKDDGKWAVIIDGQEGDAYDEVLNPAFSLDGTQFAYSAIDEGEAFVVLDNQASNKKYKDIGQVIFGKDGTLIYKVIDENGEFLVIGDQEGEHYTSIGEIVILDDGRIAFEAELDGEQVMVIDGQVVENDSSNSGTGQDTNDNGSTGSNEDDSSNDDPLVTPTPTPKPTATPTPTNTPKAGRIKKDWVIPVTEESHPVCTGSGCNF